MLIREGATLIQSAEDILEMIRHFDDRAEPAACGSEFRADREERMPVGRLGQPEDVSRAVCFLNHPDNGFITGQTLMVCGGASLGSLSL